MSSARKKYKHIEKITSSVRHLAKILTTFLTTGPRANEKSAGSFTLFNLRELLHDTIPGVGRTLTESGRIILIYSGSDYVVTDKDIVRNIVSNLLSNALKFSDKEVIIHVAASTSTRISISDKGTGMPKKEEQSPFNLFFRPRNSPMIQSTGIALHTVKRRLRLIGGRIAFESALNAGSLLTIEFPNKANDVAYDHDAREYHQE